MSNVTKYAIIIASVLVVAVGVLYFVFRSTLAGHIVIPYISHQQPMVDPHLPHSVALSDKLDEVVFDGLFNISADASGIIYEDGLGTLIGVDENNVVTVKLNGTKRWHDSYNIKMEDEEVAFTETDVHYFTAKDLSFTLRRIQNLGSLSPDYILVSQAVPDFSFEGPDPQGNIRFQFKGDREWNDANIKEVLSFKILPDGSDINAVNYNNGTAAYATLPVEESGVSDYFKSPVGVAHIPSVKLEPFIDNSTFTTELNNDNINTLLNTPFGALSPILADEEDYFAKSSIATTFFAILFNTQRLDQTQRKAARKLIDNRQVLNRFYKVGTEQQRHIKDYLGNEDNYDDYLNYSVFPSTSYYVEEQVVIPLMNDDSVGDPLVILQDTLQIAACVNFGFREEYEELIDILNDPAVTGGKVKVTAVSNEEIQQGNYDGVLLAFSGYRSNFLFDLYDVFLREPDVSTRKVNLLTGANAEGELEVSPRTWQKNSNFCRIDLTEKHAGNEQMQTLLEYIYGFMATRELGDKLAYAERIDRLDQELALGEWLFSLPSLAYFSTQFDQNSIDLWGVASQLSTIEKWREQQD